jgi:hypothetical protein
VTSDAGLAAPAAMDDQELVRQFEDCSLPNGAFRHAHHVRVAWIYLGRHPVLAAAERFAESLKRFASAHGRAGLYHETLTYAYVFLIHDRIATRGRGTSWRAFAEANPDLLVSRPSALLAYYSAERLESDLARRVFLWPDLAAPPPRRA